MFDSIATVVGTIEGSKDVVVWNFDKHRASIEYLDRSNTKVHGILVKGSRALWEHGGKKRYPVYNDSLELVRGIGTIVICRVANHDNKIIWYVTFRDGEEIKIVDRSTIDSIISTRENVNFKKLSQMITYMNGLKINTIRNDSDVWIKLLKLGIKK